MSEFKEYTINDVISLVIDYRGKTPKKLGGEWSERGYKALSAKNVKTGKIVQPDTIRYVSEEMYNKWMKDEVERGDIFITSEAPFGQIYYWDSDEKIVLSQRLFAIRPKEEFYSKYIYFYMTTPQFQAELENRSTGTTVTGLRQPELLKSKVVAPDYNIQVKIADFLYNIEKKININEAINRNLEEQAQVIFDNWFVDLEPFGGDVPSTWKIRNLGSVCNCELGGTPSRKKEEYWNGDIPWINSGAVNLFRITKPSERITELGLNKSATKLLPVKTTVLAITGATLGQVSLLEIASCANQSVVGVIPNDILPYEFVYPYIKANIEELISHQTGGAQQHINKQNVESLNVTVPDKDTIIKYVEKVTGIYSMIANSYFEIEKLTELRDALMPKLISGELDVSDLEL